VVNHRPIREGRPGQSDWQHRLWGRFVARRSRALQYRFPIIPPRRYPKLADGKPDDVLDGDLPRWEMGPGRRSPQLTKGRTEMDVRPGDRAGTLGMPVIGHQFALIPALELIVVAGDMYDPPCGIFFNDPVAQDDDQGQLRIDEGGRLPALQVGTVREIDRAVPLDVELAEGQTREGELIGIGKGSDGSPCGSGG
jgi:hypothetical protein